MTSDKTGAGATRMAAEIERKFLLRHSDSGPGIVAGLPGTALQQGYFSRIDGWVVRLRTASSELDGAVQAWLTLKSAGSGSVRQEIERPVPAAFAQRLLGILPSDRLIRKTRYRLPQGELVWEIDRFLDRHDGLWLAEIELPRPDHPLDLPAWLGAEVTDDARYRNEALAASDGDAAEIAAPPDLIAAVRRLLQQSGPKVTAPRAREARLAANLRANLMRRKQQARSRDDAAPADDPSPAGDAPAGRSPGLDREDGSA